MALWELASFRRKLSESKFRRWFVNSGIIIFNIVFTRMIVRVIAFTGAVFAQKNGWGLFNYVNTPPRIAIVISVIILDIAIYLQHIIVHAVPIFWRLHRLLKVN